MDGDSAGRDSHLRRTTLAILLASAFGAGLVAVYHALSPGSLMVDRVVTATLSVSMLGLFVFLYSHPGSAAQVVTAGCIVSLIGLVIPAWYYPVHASANGLRMVDVLPPMVPALMPLILVMVIFLRPRSAFVAASGTWALIAVPLLGYLLAHPEELRTPRGLDLVVMLGPVSMMMIAFIPFQRGVEQWVAALQGERARMQQLAERDGLTGLYNRRASESLMREFLARPMADDGLILFDIDRFKLVNDRHGHAVGDEVLRQVARRCESVLRRDDIFARWGGEEFLVLARGTHPDGIVQIAEKLRAAISAEPVEQVGIVTASFGAARIQPAESLAAWLERADAALYRAKQEGRDRVATG
jgi:diguanylate cyclase